ncbi:MAG: hypothetical protein JO179_07010, partial [Solirubrobacterales bacterium]|nr:hypothetical protein [Solirubrobacterales bacterium]
MLVAADAPAGTTAAAVSTAASPEITRARRVDFVMLNMLSLQKDLLLERQP